MKRHIGLFFVHECKANRQMRLVSCSIFKTDFCLSKEIDRLCRRHCFLKGYEKNDVETNDVQLACQAY